MRVVPIACAALFAIAACTACGSDGGAETESLAERPHGLVLYVAVKGEERALIVESLDGRARGVYRYSVSTFAAAPSGEAIAFVASSKDRNEIYVLETDTGIVERLELGDNLDGSVLNLAWSPGGDALAFAVHERTDFCGPDRVEQIRLHTVRTDGTRLRTLSWYPPSAAPLKDNPTSVSEITWSPDGRRLLYQVWQGSECEVRGGYIRGTPLALVDVSGGRPITIAVNQFPRSPVWSPDGTHVAVTTAGEGNGAVEIFDVRNGTGRTLTDVYGEVVWTKRGIYTTAAEQSSRVVLLDPANGETRFIARADVPTLAATASGSHVAVTESRLADDNSSTYRVRVFAADGTKALDRKLLPRDGFVRDENAGQPIVVVLTERK